jgi:hypothetical protein
VIPEIDIWRAANLMLKRYGEKAIEESAARADELAAQDDHMARRCGAVSPPPSDSSQTRHHPARCTDQKWKPADLPLNR